MPPVAKRRKQPPAVLMAVVCWQFGEGERCGTVVSARVGFFCLSPQPAFAIRMVYAIYFVSFASKCSHISGACRQQCCVFLVGKCFSFTGAFGTGKFRTARGVVSMLLKPLKLLRSQIRLFHGKSRRLWHAQRKHFKVALQVRKNPAQACQ